MCPSFVGRLRWTGYWIITIGHTCPRFLIIATAACDSSRLLISRKSISTLVLVYRIGAPESAILIPNHELYAQSSRHVYLRLFYAKVTVVAFCNLIYYSLESSPELIVTFFYQRFFIYLVFVSCPTAFLTPWRNKILWSLPSGICPLVCAPCL